MTPHPEVPQVDSSTEKSLSIWFFVGVLMLASGVLILGQGVYEFSHPAITDLATNVLASHHPAFWWGMVMTVFGGFYTINFRPGKG